MLRGSFPQSGQSLHVEERPQKAENRSQKSDFRGQKQEVGDRKSNPKSQRSLAVKHLLDGSISAVNVNNQIAAASPDSFFRAVVHAPNDLTIGGALADADGTLGRIYARLMSLSVGRGEHHGKRHG